MFIKHKFILYTFISFLLILLHLSYLPSYAWQEKPEAEKTIVVLISTPYYKEFYEALDGFKEALKDADIRCNYEEINISDEEDSNNDLIRSVYQQNPDLILTLGTKASDKVLEIKDIPIVFSMVGDTNFYNIDQKGKRDNDNVTGVTLTVPAQEQFAIYKEIIPKLRTIGVIYSLEENTQLINEAKQAASGLGIELIPADVTEEREVFRSLDNLIRVIDALWMIADNSVFNARERILFEMLKNDIPVLAPSKNYFSAGAAFAVGAEYKDIGRQSGDMAVKIIRGTHPSSIPVESPQNLNIYGNKKIIERIGLKIPENSQKNVIIISK